MGEPQRCLNCGRVGEDILPLGRPRSDGTRLPMAYCSPCFELARTGVPLLDGGREAKQRRIRAYRERQRTLTGVTT